MADSCVGTTAAVEDEEENDRETTRGTCAEAIEDNLRMELLRLLSSQVLLILTRECVLVSRR